MNEYGVFGPLTIPRTSHGGIDDDKLKHFWQQVEGRAVQRSRFEVSPICHRLEA